MQSEGLTQESYIVGPHSSSNEEDMDDEEEDNNNLFASSLLVEDMSSSAMASARDILKPHINEVLQCLDTLKSQESMEKAIKLLNDFANELRLELATLSGPKRNIENSRTVNMNVKENSSRKSRSYASRNC
jgi:hypothetical protein